MAAENVPTTDLQSIRPFKTGWRIHVKIIHVWKQNTVYSGETIEMVLANISGTLIHATVKKPQFGKFQRLIKSGQWVIIDTFTMTRSAGKFRVTNHPYRMTLINITSMVPCASLTNDMFLQLVDFEKVIDEAGLNENILVDVVGQVVNVGELKIHQVENKDKKKVEFELRDIRDDRLSCTLWGGFAERILAACENNRQQVVICLLRFAKINSFKEAISRAIYGDFASLQTKKDAKFFQERAILAPRNDDVNTINQIMLDKLPGEEKSFLSCDCIDPTDLDSADNPVFTPDFLNSIKISGLPNHNLRLKVGAPIMLLRKLDPKGGLCNGTRLQITQMADHVLEAMVITGDRSGDLVLIPQTFIKPSDTKLPFKMRRRQFPIALAFAMTINKSQGQSLNEVGLFLPRPVFSHGQLYVALSRVTSKKGLKVLIVDKEGEIQRQTMNVVFKEVFQNL